MKKLSIEEKAKAYDRAFKEAEKIHNFSSDIAEVKRMEQIFPELKESDDERIRKELTEFLKKASGGFLDSTMHCKTFGKWLAWLEKQGEKEPIISNDALREGITHFGITQYQIDNWLKKYVDVEKQQKTTDKVESKFKAGDWVVNKDGKVNQVVAIDDDCDGFTLDDSTYFSGSWKDIYHLWTIQDAKDGDVLYSPCCKLLWIYKDEKTCHVGFNLNYNSGGIVINKPVCIPTDVQPATKEQRDLLFKKMHEAGYEWDAENKELKKVEQKPIEEYNITGISSKHADGKLGEMIKNMESANKVEQKFKVGDVMRTTQEAADGIKDGMPVVVSIDEEYYHCNNELIAIKDQDSYEYPPMNRIQKPAWSEEDETGLTNTIIMLKEGASLHFNKKDITKAVNWLKSLRPKNTWKPSDEQMEVLLSEVTAWTKGCPKQIVLESLYNDLKKLKG